MTIYIILGLMLLLSSLFSGIEIAFVSSSKFKIELSKESKSLADRIISKFALNDSIFITTLLIGNNIALVVFSYFMSKVFIQDFGIAENALLLQTVLTTIIVLIFGEFLPKTIFSAIPLKSLKFFAVFVNILVFIPFQYLATFFTFLSNKIIGIFLKVDENEQDQFNSTDLKHYIKGLINEENSDGDDDEINADFFEKALEFKDLKVRECMIPRMELVAVNIQTTISDLKKEFIDSKHSRILVYKESIDDIIGYVHHYDLFKNPKTIKSILYDVVSVPETLNARDLLSLFTNENKNIAYVFDEYGGTSGIITLEDLVEEIFGEIEDEYDTTQFIEKALEKQEYDFEFSARLEIDYLNERYQLEIPEGDYETLAGFIVVVNEDIPETGEVIEINDFKIKIITADDNRLETVQIKKLVRSFPL